jgi:hypothetical protein
MRQQPGERDTNLIASRPLVEGAGQRVLPCWTSTLSGRAPDVRDVPDDASDADVEVDAVGMQA